MLKFSSLYFFFIALSHVLFCRPPASEIFRPQQEMRVQAALERTHQEEFDAAESIISLMIQDFPSEPIGCFLAANLCHTKMRHYRTKDMQAKFDSLIAMTQMRALKTVELEPNAGNLFLFGVANGYSSVGKFRNHHWIAAIRSAKSSVRTLKRVTEIDPLFVDPLYGLALFDYGKSRIFGGLFPGCRRRSIAKLAKVEKEGLYLSHHAAYLLQILLMEEHDYEGALEINDRVYQHYPNNSACLYRRAKILGHLEKHAEALETWQNLIERIDTFPVQANGYLAECHYHCAKSNLQLSRINKGWTHLVLAANIAGKYDSQRELESPDIEFSELHEKITLDVVQWQKRYAHIVGSDSREVIGLK
jgi:hypothetical protein